MREHVRHYEIAGITVQVESDLPMTNATFDKRFASFRAQGSGPDTVEISHHFGLPEYNGADEDEQVYSRPPWTIHRRGEAWIYRGIRPGGGESSLYRMAVFDADHSHGHIHSDESGKLAWLKGGLCSLTMFPSDQILLARLVADRSGCLLHSAAAKIDGKGVVFVGHSAAGKSTTVELIRQRLGARAEILCDDRNILRLWPDGLRVHGTWSRGDIPEVSSASAPVRAVLFLKQDAANELVPVADRKQSWQRLLATLVKPLTTVDWWHKEIDVLEQIVARVPCFHMRFDQSGAIVGELERLVQ